MSSRYFGLFANARISPWLLRLLIRFYVKIFRIDLSEYDFNLQEITTFNAFFTRKLLSGTRTWERGICSPVDGRVMSVGSLEKGKLFQVKGVDYTLEDLVGIKVLDRGSFINLYLSPADYHRVHAPMDMTIESITHIPGKLLSVSSKNAKFVKGLYTGNERVILSGKNKLGRFYFVFVGALNVGSIALSFFPELKTNLWKDKTKNFDHFFEIKKGEELGWFEMGSTIIFILESDHFKDNPLVKEQDVVRLGKALA